MHSMGCIRLFTCLGGFMRVVEGGGGSVCGGA